MKVYEFLKKEVKDLLKQRDYDRLLNLCEKDEHFRKELHFHLYGIDERFLWPAIEATGKLMHRWWQSGRENKVREYIRNLFWSITDESGGIGWSAPQTIAEIIANIPILLDPYGSMMVAHAFEEPSLVRGGLWGIGRLGKEVADSVNFFQDRVLAAFHIDDAETLGLAAWAMGEVGFKPALPFLERLTDRRETIRIYIKGDFYEKPLGQWAEEAMKKMSVKIQ